MVRKILKGAVISGLGEGGYYVRLYSDQFEQILGGEPYHGTLNVKLLDPVFNFNDCHTVVIPPPSKSLFPVVAVLGSFHGERVLIIRPLATRHGENIIEIVATANLREKFKLRDGDIVELLVEC